MAATALDVVPPHALRSLYDAAGARQWDLEYEAFVEAMARSAGHRFGETTPALAALRAYLEGLHLSDLALAAACAAGHEPAWEAFVAAYRGPLRRAARAIVRADDGDDLADALFGELFGLVERDGQRRSLFQYFHGRSTLATWLRSVLAQRHVDVLRARRRDVPLDEAEMAGDRADASGLARHALTLPSDPDRARLGALLASAVKDEVSSLAPRDRLRLSLYYRNGVKLAAIGRTLGEHEATVSRQLERTRRAIRTGVEQALATRHGLEPGDIQTAFDAALADPALALDTLMGSPSAAAPALLPGLAPGSSCKAREVHRSMEEESGTTT